MKRSNNDIQKVKKIIVPILKRHQVKRASIFGSYARGEASKSSDIDLLIDFHGRKSLFDLSGLKIDLEDSLHKKVDLATPRSVSPFLKKYIYPDLVKIYEKAKRSKSVY